MITCTPLAVFRQRLLNAARSVMEYDHSEDRVRRGEIYMGGFIKSCGAPACVLGHYAAREDLQDDFKVFGFGIVHKYGGFSLGFDSGYVRKHFNLKSDELKSLFGEQGCGNATRAKQVSEYMNNFVAKKYPQWQ